MNLMIGSRSHFENFLERLLTKRVLSIDQPDGLGISGPFQQLSLSEIGICKIGLVPMPKARSKNVLVLTIRTTCKPTLNKILIIKVLLMGAGWF